jgi:hypothetical protein
LAGVKSSGNGEGRDRRKSGEYRRSTGCPTEPPDAERCREDESGDLMAQPKTYVVLGDDNFWYSTFYVESERDYRGNISALLAEIDSGQFTRDRGALSPAELTVYEVVLKEVKLKDIQTGKWRSA